MPLSVIQRPIVPVLDESKVCSMIDTLNADSSKIPPIDVLWIQKNDNDYYFSFGGCHRYEAHRRLGRSVVRVKLIRVDEGEYVVLRVVRSLSILI